MARGLPLLTVIAALAACVDEPPPPGTSIGAFSFVANFQKPAEGKTTAEDPLGDPGIACVPEHSTLPRCMHPADPEDPLVFDAVITYEPDGSGTSDFHLQPGSDSTRNGKIDGTHFYTVAPELSGCSSVGVPRELPECENCTITAVEWIRGDLLERLPDAGCEGAAGSPSTGFDPAAFGAICGELVVRVTLTNTDPAEACSCWSEGRQQSFPEDLKAGDVPPEDCAIVYTLTGTRS